jgi:hypothetical protein
LEMQQLLLAPAAENPRSVVVFEKVKRRESFEL